MKYIYRYNIPVRWRSCKYSCGRAYSTFPLPQLNNANIHFFLTVALFFPFPLHISHVVMCGPKSTSRTVGGVFITHTHTATHAHTRMHTCVVSLALSHTRKHTNTHTYTWAHRHIHKHNSRVHKCYFCPQWWSITSWHFFKKRINC